ncbi:hypothetical protein ACIRBY_02165 [Streptomyces sp. NPDC096136]|uniref:hypothetical protein n=1 Tax=Streptomyces sp. NPDC096136 TaxID=3366076 RepID=UPI003819997F
MSSSSSSGGGALRRLGVLAAVLGVLAAPSAGAAWAGPGAGPGRGAPLPAGAPTPTAADALAAAVDAAAPAGYGDTYAGVSVDAKAGRVTVFATDVGRGRALASAAERSAHAGGRVRVEVKAAKYSRQRLEAARTELEGAADGWRASGPRITMISFGAEGDGLRVAADDPSRAAELNRARPVRQGAGAGIDPADVRFLSAAPAALVDRDDDGAPHWGGATITSSSGQCTTAFAMDVPGWDRYVVTAAHCGGPGTHFTSGSRDYGTVFNTLPDIDAGIIKTAGGSNSGVYIGTEGRYYADWVWSRVGQEVCQSGSVTRYRCGIFVTGDSHTYEHGIWVQGGIEACTRDGSTAGRHGDSGGPVFNWRADGKITSRGVISYGYSTSASSGGYDCIGWSQTGHVLASWQASLVTS